MKIISYSVIGGDLRNAILSNLLAFEKASVKTYALSGSEMEKLAFECDNLKEAVNACDAVIGPLPCSNDDETLNAPFHKEKIHINELFQAMNQNQMFMAGRITEKVKRMAELYNIKYIDYLEREEMAVLNAIPTSEGAIQIAMEEMPITLHMCNALVMGYGRIGKLLSKTLLGMGSGVFVTARKYRDLAWISAYGYHPVQFGNLSEALPDMDVIFNTIPHLVLDDEKLSLLKKDCLVIDLASKPGGVDLNAARIRNIKTIWALSIPGKVAPMTAARYIRDTIRNVLYELEV